MEKEKDRPMTKMPGKKGMPGPNQMQYLIRQRAYELSLQCPTRSELDNWLQAEQEIKWHYTVGP
jgi:hypothetical protein